MKVIKPDSTEEINIYHYRPRRRVSGTATGDYKKLRSVFLAGSIEMGVAENWQERAQKLIYINEANEDTVVYNPRRDNWDNTWEQDESCKEFTHQVSWELNHLDGSQHIIMYFDPSTKSPITLLELGLYASAHPDKLKVICPKGFWKKGNVDIVCRRYGVKQYDTLEEAIQSIYWDYGYENKPFSGLNLDNET